MYKRQVRVVIQICVPSSISYRYSNSNNKFTVFNFIFLLADLGTTISTLYLATTLKKRFPFCALKSEAIETAAVAQVIVAAAEASN